MTFTVLHIYIYIYIYMHKIHLKVSDKPTSSILQTHNKYQFNLNVSLWMEPV